MAVPNIQPIGPVDDEETFNVEMTIAEALGAGWSMQALAIQGRMPPSTAAIYRRIGERMVKLAKAEMQKRVEAAQASGSKARSK